MNEDEGVVHRVLETDEDPTAQIAMIVGELSSSDPGELPTLYDCVDGMLEELFSTPPSDEAEIEVVFSYAGYRITIEQDGVAKFVDVNEGC